MKKNTLWSPIYHSNHCLLVTRLKKLIVKVTFQQTYQLMAETHLLKEEESEVILNPCLLISSPNELLSNQLQSKLDLILRCLTLACLCSIHLTHSCILHFRVISNHKLKNVKNQTKASCRFNSLSPKNTLNRNKKWALRMNKELNSIATINFWTKLNLLLTKNMTKTSLWLEDSQKQNDRRKLSYILKRRNEGRQAKKFDMNADLNLLVRGNVLKENLWRVKYLTFMILLIDRIFQKFSKQRKSDKIS